MSDCRYCGNTDGCQYIIAPNDCEDFEDISEFKQFWDDNKRSGLEIVLDGEVGESE